ncbi:MAG TPA: YciI-like protein [Pyrinomonadaceae bacterium]
MHFVLFYDIVGNFAEKRTPYRAEHLANVRTSHAAGKLILAGALTDPVDGAMLVFRGPTAQAAEEFAKTDPYVTSGLVTKWRVREWTTVIGDGATMPSVPDATGFSG